MNLPVELRALELRAPLRSEVLLSRYSTFHIGGPARFFSEPQTLKELETLLEFARDEALPVLGIGKGSNILFPDEGFGGLVITFIHFEQERILFNREAGTVTVSSGVNLYRLALAMRDEGLGGVEFLSHIPGTVGGALVMNAGFSRVRGEKKEMSDLVEEVTVLTSEGQVRCLSRSEIEFGYRKSSLAPFIILEARLKLIPSTPEKIQKEIEACFEYRNHVQDLRYPSAGSVFKNPGGSQGSSGQLIERSGLSGKRIGGAMISDRHANFIVNVGGAKAADVLALVSLAQETVLEQFGIHLEPEIRIIRNP